jgi:hypothetical protein
MISTRSRTFFSDRASANSPRRFVL